MNDLATASKTTRARAVTATSKTNTKKALTAVPAILQGNVPAVVERCVFWVRPILHRYTYLASYGLLYIEESGIPLPAPGDVFGMYVGAHVPRHLAAWLTAWLGLIGVVVLGATNLFFISKRYGRRLAPGPLGEVVHLNPDRLAPATTSSKPPPPVPATSPRPTPRFTV